MSRGDASLTRRTLMMFENVGLGVLVEFDDEEFALIEPPCMHLTDASGPGDAPLVHQGRDEVEPGDVVAVGRPRRESLPFVPQLACAPGAVPSPNPQPGLWVGVQVVEPIVGSTSDRHDIDVVAAPDRSDVAAPRFPASPADCGQDRVALWRRDPEPGGLQVEELRPRPRVKPVADAALLPPHRRGHERRLAHGTPLILTGTKGRSIVTMYR